MKKLNLILLFTLVISAICTAGASDTNYQRPAYIGWINYQNNINNADFRALPGVPNCCPYFNNGEGAGFSLGLDFEFPLPHNLFTGFGIGYYDRSSSLTAYEIKQVRSGNEIIDAKIQHAINADISDIDVTPYLSYNIFGGLFVKISGHIGYFVNGTFRQYEQIVEPTDRGVFVDTGTRRRNDTTGNIPNMSSVCAGVAPEIHYDFKLDDNSSWILSPSVSYTFGLTKIIKDFNWKINTASVGLRLRYSPVITNKPVYEEFNEHSKIDTITVLSEDYFRNTVIPGVETFKTSRDKHKNKIINDTYKFRRDTLFKRPVPRINLNINLSQLYLNGQFVTQAFPLVPDVFFKLNSDRIDDFYITNIKAGEFNTDSLHIDALSYQRNLLNIVGQRMQTSKGTRLTIKGFCDSVTEGNNSGLALKRAHTIRSYLTDHWAIDPGRLILPPDNRVYPEDHTETRNDSGFSENRRVLLSSDNPELLAPIRNRRFIEPRQINPPTIIIDPDGSTSKGIVSWNLKITKGPNVISKKTGTGAPAVIVDSLRMVEFSSLFSNDPLILHYSMIDGEGQTAELTKEIPVVADTFEFEVQRLSLILFGVASSELSEKAKNDIRVFLTGITPNAKIRITGYTDALGSYSMNKSLSESRARNTADYVKRILPAVKIESVKGEASRIYPPGIISYRLPTERFLSRTVFIEVLNKIK